MQQDFSKLNALGCVVECHDVLVSTQIRVRELAREGAERAVVIAGEQTAGRGRLARHWNSPKGSGIYFSILFRPVFSANIAHMVNIAAALSVSEAVRALLGLELELKWPNDLLVSHKDRREKPRKVSGILSESAMRGGALDYYITGIGLNLYVPDSMPPELRDRAGWLCEADEKGERDIDAPELLFRVISNFFAWVSSMERGEVNLMLEEYRKKCASIGRFVRVEADSQVITGLCCGIGNEGQLLVETDGEIKFFHVADITHAGLV